MVDEINTNLDTTGLPQNTYQAKDSEAATLANWIRQKTYGRHVRESIARFVELTSDKVFDTVQMTSETVRVANDLTNRFNRQIGALTEDSEVIDARGGYDVLGSRLQQADELLNDTKRNFARIYPTQRDLENSTEHKEGDFVEIKGWKMPYDMSPMVLKVMAKDSPEMTEKRLNMAFVLANGLYAVPMIDNFLPNGKNDIEVILEMREILDGYIANKTQFAYDGSLSGSVYRTTHPSTGEPWTPIREDGKFPITCSDFVWLGMMAVPFENSRYLNPAGENISKYDWAYNALNGGQHGLGLLNYSADMARQAYQSGNFYTPNDDWTNLQSGDVLFFAQPQELQIQDGNVNTAFLNIYHVAIYYGGNMYQAHNGASLISYDPIYNSTNLAFMKDRLVGFARYPLGDRKSRFKHESTIPQSANVAANKTFLELYNGRVTLNIKGTRLNDGLTGSQIIGTIPEKYRPYSGVVGVAVAYDGKTYRLTVSSTGEVACVFPTATNLTEINGQLSWPLKRPFMNYTNY